MHVYMQMCVCVCVCVCVCSDVCVNIYECILHLLVCISFNAKNMISYGNIEIFHEYSICFYFYTLDVLNTSSSEFNILCVCVYACV